MESEVYEAELELDQEGETKIRVKQCTVICIINHHVLKGMNNLNAKCALHYIVSRIGGKLKSKSGNEHITHNTNLLIQGNSN